MKKPPPHPPFFLAGPAMGLRLLQELLAFHPAGERRTEECGEVFLQEGHFKGCVT